MDERKSELDKKDMEELPKLGAKELHIGRAQCPDGIISVYRFHNPDLDSLASILAYFTSRGEELITVSQSQMQAYPPRYLVTTKSR